MVIEFEYQCNSNLFILYDCDLYHWQDFLYPFETHWKTTLKLSFRWYFPDATQWDWEFVFLSYWIKCGNCSHDWNIRIARGSPTHCSKTIFRINDTKNTQRGEACACFCSLFSFVFCFSYFNSYSTVTDFAKFLGLSTSSPLFLEI